MFPLGSPQRGGQQSNGGNRSVGSATAECFSCHLFKILLKMVYTVGLKRPTLKD